MLQIVIYKKLNFWEEYTPLEGGQLGDVQGVQHGVPLRVQHGLVSL